MKKLVSTLIGVSIGASALSGCSWMNDDKGLVQNRQNDYLLSKPTEPMAIPDGLDKTLIQDVYVIPPVEGNPVLSDSGDVPAPAPLIGDIDASAIKIQKLEDNRWILIAVSPSHVWYALHQFLVSQEIPVAKEQGNIGLVESGWMRASEKQGYERFLFRVDQGLQRNSSEVFIRQVERPSKLTWDGSWSARSDNSAREQEMVQALAQFLAQEQPGNEVSFLAQSISTKKRLVMLHDDNGELFVRIDANWYRSWAATGSAIKKAGFALVDMNIDEGEFYIAPTKVKKKGWFGIGSSEEVVPTEHTYVLRLNRTETKNRGVEIRVYDTEGNVMSEADSAHILNRVKGALS